MTFSTAGQTRASSRHVHVFFGSAVANGVYRTPGYFESDPHSEARPMFSVPESQLYFWSEPWQRAEREALAELERGEGVTFDDPADAVRWLLSD